MLMLIRINFSPKIKLDDIWFIIVKFRTEQLFQNDFFFEIRSYWSIEAFFRIFIMRMSKSTVIIFGLIRNKCQSPIQYKLVYVINLKSLNTIKFLPYILFFSIFVAIHWCTSSQINKCTYITHNVHNNLLIEL